MSERNQTVQDDKVYDKAESMRQWHVAGSDKQLQFTWIIAGLVQLSMMHDCVLVIHVAHVAWTVFLLLPSSCRLIAVRLS